MSTLLWSSEFWLSLLTLTTLEIVLGIDNLVFISIISSRVRQDQQRITRRLGLLGALVIRLILLASVFWLVGLTNPLFSFHDKSFSIRDLILIGGGLFLLVKATTEIHSSMLPEQWTDIKQKATLVSVAIAQIMIFDLIFSLDSIMTAVALTDFFMVMAAAIIIAVIMMMIASEPLHRFIHRYPTLKMLALSFLLLVGVMLIAEGFGFHIPREYIYFAMSFSMFVEILNNLARRRRSH